MKKTIFGYATVLTILSASPASAQISSVSENLDINLFKAAHMVHGDMWNNLATGNPACEYPKGSGKHANYMSSIWMSGKDNSGTLHTSAQMYRSGGKVDYYPGPLDASGSLSAGTTANWAKIWKVDASTINSFKTAYASGGASAITAVKYDVIKQWPATGNIYALGATGAALPELLAPSTAVQYYAPFVDVNSDGVYNWKDGDYPNIKGDQMLWWVFSDNGPTHTSSMGLPLKVEYHAMVYGYSRGTDVDRIIFYEFTMYNKSTDKYNEFRFGLFSDADLGNAFDDYIAFDSTHRMGIEYNAQIPDGAGTNSYGNHPPITGLSLLEMPGDVYPSAMLPAGTFNYFNNTTVGPLRNPLIDTTFNHYMHAKNADGIPQYFGNYAYPISKGAVMCDSNFPKGDRRYLITTNDYAFQPGTKTKIAMAFMATDTTGNACPGVDFKPITNLADTAWKVYWSPLPPLSTQEIALVRSNFKLYPNPAKSILYVQTNGNTNNQEQLKIVDALGKNIAVAMTFKGTTYEINIGSLPSGIYSVLYFDGSTVSTQRFVKE